MAGKHYEINLVSAKVLNRTRKQSSLSDDDSNVDDKHVERWTHCYCCMYNGRIR